MKSLWVIIMIWKKNARRKTGYQFIKCQINFIWILEQCCFAPPCRDHPKWDPVTRSMSMEWFPTVSILENVAEYTTLCFDKTRTQSYKEQKHDRSAILKIEFLRIGNAGIDSDLIVTLKILLQYSVFVCSHAVHEICFNFSTDTS